MKRLGRWTALFMAAVMVLTLSACGNKTDDSETGTSMGTLEGAVFSSETLELPENLSYIDALEVYNDQIYMAYTAEEEVGEYEYNYHRYIAKMDIDGGNRSEIEIKSDSTNVSIRGMYPAADGSIWVFCYEYYETYDENGEWLSGEEKNSMMRISPEGETVETVGLASVFEGIGEYYSLDSFIADNNGNWYFVLNIDGKSSIVSTDNTGSEQFRLELEESEWVIGLITTGDGDVAICTNYYNAETSEYGYTIRVIDPETQGWGSEYKLDSGSYSSIYSGKDCFAYMGDSTRIYEYDPETGEKKVLINWVDNDLLVTYPDYFTALGDGKFLFVNWDYNDYTSSLVVMTKTADSFGDQTVITLAGLYIPYDIQKAVVDFNKTNGEYRIKIKSYYSDYGYEEAATQMKTAIITGVVPDIFYCGDELSADWLAARGLLTDLYPYIDGDSDISREDFVESVLRVAEIDGCLYQMVCSFYTFSVVGRSDVVGTDMGWTVQDMKTLFEQYPEADIPFGQMTRQDFLYYMFMFGMDDYIDWSTGKCSFDSDSFIELLEFAATFRSSYDEEGMGYEEAVAYSEEEYSEDSPIKSGRQLLSFGYISDFRAVQNYKSEFGGEITFIGFPVSEGAGNAMCSGLSMGISSTSGYKDAAWEFIKTFLTDDYQNSINYSYPVTKAALYRLAQRAMAGEDYEYDASYLEEMGIVNPTQEEIDKIMEYIDSIDRVYTYDNSILEIINEEAEPFFAGDKTARETAKIIQNRMETYINEQR